MVFAGRKLQGAATPFTIYCDEPSSLVSPDSAYDSSNTFDIAAKKHNDTRVDSPLQSPGIDSVVSYGSCSSTVSTSEYDDDDDDSYISTLRRNITATSVSSLPPSALPSENEEFFTPAKTPRPSYRSPSLRRVPVGASSSDRLSPHKSFRAGGSPRRHANVRVSPRPRTRERHEQIEMHLNPLVLLHVTIFPIRLPWNQSTVEKALPGTIKARLTLLKSHVSDTILQRGVLVPHPQDEFQLLEERVLEALGLDPLGGTSDDHGDGYEDILEHESLDRDESCQTCGDPNCFSRRVEKSWEVRVYAANGLMRAGAWTAAWSEMERVDLEILPFMSRGVRRRLDQVQAEEDARVMVETDRRMREGEDNDMEEKAKQVPVVQEEKTEPREEQTPLLRSNPPAPIEVTFSAPEAPTEPTSQSFKQRKQASRPKADTSLPAAYRAEDIPLRTLLRNYLYVLAQDRRNVAILFLLATIVFSTVHGMRLAKGDSFVGISNNHTDADLFGSLAIEVGGVNVEENVSGALDLLSTSEKYDTVEDVLSSVGVFETDSEEGDLAHQPEPAEEYVAQLLHQVDDHSKLDAKTKNDEKDEKDEAVIDDDRMLRAVGKEEATKDEKDYLDDSCQIENVLLLATCPVNWTE